MDKISRLKIENLHKSISGRPIIKGIDLELYEGEVLGLIGPNGAGKSTTIKMLTGLFSKTAGKIYYGDLDYDKDFLKIKQHFGAIVENPDLYTYLTGKQHLDLIAKLYPETTKADIDEAVDMVNMKNALSKKIKAYSLGMKQRLAIAAILLTKAELIILDEPFNGLDPQGIRDLRLVLRKLSRERGITVLVSSHLLGEVQALCDRIAMISQGKIVAVFDMESLTQNIQENSVKIMTSDQGKLLEYFTERQIPFSQDLGFVKINCDLDNINQLITDLIAAEFKIYAIEPVHKSLEDLFMEVMSSRGGVIS